jgi:hypothetical protein
MYREVNFFLYVLMHPAFSNSSRCAWDTLNKIGNHHAQADAGPSTSIYLVPQTCSSPNLQCHLLLDRTSAVEAMMQPSKAHGTGPVWPNIDCVAYITLHFSIVINKCWSEDKSITRFLYII